MSAAFLPKLAVTLGVSLYIVSGWPLFLMSTTDASELSYPTGTMDLS